jgi:hypothetical protein
MPVRLRAAVVVLVLGLAAGVAGVTVIERIAPAGSPSGPAPAGALVPDDPAEAPALSVLRDWDARRSAAWAAGDVDGLALLYVPGSSAGAADVGLLRRYRARGLVVRDLRMQILRVRVVTSRPRRLVLEVTDRVASAIAYAATGARRLPRDAATSHELVLRRVDGAWRMARVSPTP